MLSRLLPPSLWQAARTRICPQHYDNKLFISATNFTDEMLIKAANSSYEREITAGIAKPVGQDISIEFAAAPELFDHYRQAFYDET